MASASSPIHFGPFEVTDQVFYKAPLSYGLINIKPILPGHVLVIPYRIVQRFTDLTPAEVTDLFTTVQKVQKMLARSFFNTGDLTGQATDGGFNIAIQDGKESGQTVPHVHCHIIPRPKSDTLGDEVYQKLQGEEGNIGGGFFDLSRPTQLGKFPEIKDEDRKPRSMDEMKKEAALYQDQMDLLNNS
ncbi:hypothetical protein K3495_g4586 [Podosphaera aphanis]|nr:hypothetical protein K3495_g4586 [Podosphaera aphanis]